MKGYFVALETATIGTGRDARPITTLIFLDEKQAKAQITLTNGNIEKFKGVKPMIQFELVAGFELSNAERGSYRPGISEIRFQQKS